MPKIRYEYDKRPNNKTMEMIEAANEIIEEYVDQGFDLTLRQLYYQFVSRGYIPNKQAEYDKLGTIINTGRMIGEIDWLHIVDRTRYLRRVNAWDKPSSVLRASAEQYKIDLWKRQQNRVEVWIEKDALVGVIKDICNEWRVPFFSCRGYVSASEMWQAARRISRAPQGTTTILHLGDHDPSGIDMTRDINDRISLFLSERGDTLLDVRRIALNMDQIEALQPPPNPAKSTDSRFNDYVENYGEESWELDALEPSYLSELIEQEVVQLIDNEMWEEDQAEEEHGRQKLMSVVNLLEEEEEG